MNKRKRSCLVLWLAVHLVVSFVLWGTLRVMQRGYNATHREPLAMASLTLRGETAVVQVLDESCEIPVTLLAEDSPLYYALYCLTDGMLHLLLCGLGAVV